MDLMKDYSRKVTAGRLSETLALLALAVLFIAMLPAGYFVSVFAYALIVIVYVLLLLIVCILTLFTALMNEGFRALFTVDESAFLSEFHGMALSVAEVLPYLIVGAVLLCAGAILLGWKNSDKKGVKGKIIGLTVLCIVVVYTVLFYIFADQILAEVVIK